MLSDGPLPTLAAPLKLKDVTGHFVIGEGYHPTQQVVTALSTWPLEHNFRRKAHEWLTYKPRVRYVSRNPFIRL